MDDVIGVHMTCSCGGWDLEVPLHVDLEMMQSAILRHRRECSDFRLDAVPVGA